MRGKRWIAGFLTAGILVAVALLLLLSGTSGQGGDGNLGETGRHPITDFSMGEVSAIEVRNTSGEVYTIRLEESGLSIDGIDPDVPLRKTLLLPVINMLLQAVSYSAPFPAESGEEYGLEVPRAVFTIRLMNGETTVLQLGNETVKKNGCYLRSEGHEELYVAEYAYETLAGYGAWDYIDPVLVGIDQSQGFTISRLTLTNREAGTNLKIARKAANGSDPSIYSYQVSGLNEYDAADEKLNAYLFDSLTLLRAAGVYSLDVSQENLEELGLLDPAYTLSFLDDWRGEAAFRFSRLEDGTVLALAEGTPVVYELEEADASFLDLTLDQIVSPFLTLQSINEVECFVVWDGKEEYEFVLQNGSGEEELLVDYQGTSVDTASFRKLYSRAATIYIQGMAEPPEEENLILRLTYSRRDGEAHTTEFFGLDGRRCYVAVDGRGEFYVRLTDIEYFLEGVYACIRGEALTQ